MTTSERDINDFSTLLRNALLTLPTPVTTSEWITYVCSPIEFKANSELSAGSSIWNRQLTLWTNYSRFGSVLASDKKYAFSPPAGFLKQIARRASSWESFHQVDPKRDVSIQLFSSVGTTPQQQWDITAMRQHIEGQFIPWICPSIRVHELNQQLYPLELTFRTVEGVTSPLGQKVGIICPFFFEPGVGLFSPADAWSEFTDGKVQSKLETTGALSKILGQRGPEEVSEVILNMLGDLLEEPPENFLITERHYDSGLPLDHRERRVQVQRFREVETLDRALANKILKQCKKSITGELGKDQWVNYSLDLFEAWPYKQIAELSIAWQPLFEDSSSESFDRIESLVIQAFDKILPRNSRSKKKRAMTYDVLKMAGSLYFEDEK